MTSEANAARNSLIRAHVERFAEPTIERYRQMYSLLGERWPGDSYVRHHFTVVEVQPPELLPDAPSRVGIVPGWYAAAGVEPMEVHRLNTFAHRGIGGKETLCGKTLQRTLRVTDSVAGMTVCARCRSRADKAPGHADPPAPGPRVPLPSLPRSRVPATRAGRSGVEANSVADRVARRRAFATGVLRGPGRQVSGWVR